MIVTVAAPWWNRPVPRRPHPLLDDPVSSAGLPSFIRPELRVWVGETREQLLDGRDPGRPSAATRFPALAPELGGAGTDYWVGGARVGVDGSIGHPIGGHGGRLAFEVERYENPSGRQPQLFSAGGSAPSFTRMLVEGEVGGSFFRDPHTLRLAFRFEDRRSDGDSLLRVSDLARLGGARGLAGFEAGGFVDRDLANGRLA